MFLILRVPDASLYRTIKSDPKLFSQTEYNHQLTTYECEDMQPAPSAHREVAIDADQTSRLAAHTRKTHEPEVFPQALPRFVNEGNGKYDRMLFLLRIRFTTNNYVSNRILGLILTWRNVPLEGRHLQGHIWLQRGILKLSPCLSN